MSIAEETIQFLKDTQQEFDGYCQKHNAGAELEKKSWDTPLGPVQVVLSRGKIFEKASYIYCDLEIETPPILAEKMGWHDKKMRALVLEIGLHPVNPHVPKGYIELRANIGDSVILAGGTDLFPYFPNDEDRDVFAQAIKDACAGHGVDYEALRKVRADFFQSKFRKVKVGYHAGIYTFHLGGDNLPFFRDMAKTFFATYGDIIQKRQTEPVSEADRQHQLKLHGQWAEWIMVEDEGTRFGLIKGIPPEALLGAILPPIATF